MRASEAVGRRQLADLPAQLAAGLDGWADAAPGTVFSVAVPLPLPALTHLPPGLPAARWWARPAEGRVRLGLGTALRMCLRGPDRLQRLARAVDELRSRWRHSGDGAPAAFVGLAFDRAGEADLQLPLLQLDQSGLATFAAVRATQQPGEVLEQWEAAARALMAAAAQPLRRAPPRWPKRVGEWPPPQTWRGRVAAAVAAIGAGQFGKVVLTRRIRVTAPSPFDVARLTHGLGVRHPGCAILAFDRGDGAVLVAATPERLASLAGAILRTDALAGTCRGGRDAAEDQRLDRHLLADPKERHEHQLVVDGIAEALAGICDDLDIPTAPRLMRLAQLRHLWTPIQGRLRPGFGLLDALARLHPTPAVAGLPVARALDWLRQAGDDRDDWYTGAAGWIDRDGDGEFHVVLRAALVRGSQADLYAGAGIVGQSDPEAEFAETELKLRTMLDALREA